MTKYRQASEIKTGVIGYGPGSDMGKRHLTQMRNSGMRPCCVVELSPERREVAGKDFPGIELYASVEEMLDKSEVDLLAIITPHNTHYPIALQCLRGGKHVVCEKPMALTTAECDELIAEGQRRGLLATAYHNRHWNGDTLQLVKKVGQERAIGKIIRIELHPRVICQLDDSWRSNRKLSGGIAYDWGVHLLEAALQLVDGNLVEVAGYAHSGLHHTTTRWGADVVEDEFQLTARFDNGVWVMLNVSKVDCLPKRTERGLIEVTGTEGTFVSEPSGWKIHRRVGDQIITESGSNLSDQWQCFYDEVRDYIVQDTRLTITPEWARRPVHILDLARQSIAVGRALPAIYP
jgi:predicted dehydrogenase